MIARGCPDESLTYDFFRIPRPPESLNRRLPVLRRGGRFHERCLDSAGTDRVDGDAGIRQFPGEVLGQTSHTVFGDRVFWTSEEGHPNRCRGADVHDSATTLLHHLRNDRRTIMHSENWTAH